VIAGTGFQAVWAFSVEPLNQPRFEFLYGPEGRWVQLFRRAPGYLGTELLRDRADPTRYLTIDRWESADAFRAFQTQFASEYQELDRECEGLTARESAAGEYESLPGQPG
jgi:heme-degrading monooxygenase HmoA